MSTYVIATPGSVQRDLDKTTRKSRRRSPACPTLDPENIAQLAYSLWQQRGCPEGESEKDWFEAERQFTKLAIKARLARNPSA
ncbi:MAG: DUF2934 domain-containing protein [Acidobacteriaceae bacterium]|nr:DUF2934 domain-containing protein [Acidobacteriaceae bacterium]MBV9499277.1 DUF2934 domain-containing protein [Acidobacteriaceae bacterium]